MNLADDAAPEGLTKVGARPLLRAYLVEVWNRREFIFSLARFRMEAENQKNRLGMGWIVLKPLIEAGVYGLIFGVLLGSASRPPHFVEFLIIGVFLFQFFAQTFSSGAKAITSNQALVQSLSFPRMSLPLALVTQRLLQFLPMVAIMMVIVVIFGTMPSWQWLLLAPMIALYTIFNAGLSMITARLTVHFRDLSQLLPFVTRLLFYTTGIFFSIDKRFDKHPTFLKIADFQPIHEFLSLGRSLLLTGPDYAVKTEYWLYATVWAFGIFAVGTVFFWAAEERYGRTN